MIHCFRSTHTTRPLSTDQALLAELELRKKNKDEQKCLACKNLFTDAVADWTSCTLCGLSACHKKACVRKLLKHEAGCKELHDRGRVLAAKRARRTAEKELEADRARRRALRSDASPDLSERPRRRSNRRCDPPSCKCSIRGCDEFQIVFLTCMFG